MSEPQKMTLKEARNAGLIGHPNRNVMVPTVRRSIRHAGAPNAKGIMRVETVPDFLDGRESKEMKLGASTFVVVFDIAPAPTPAAQPDLDNSIEATDLPG